MGRSTAAAALAAVLATLAVGCGSDDESPAGSPNGGPERIVSLSPTATETLFAIGAGKQVVAVDDQSDYPPGVPRTELSAHQPNLEAIADYRPDLVVVSEEAPSDLVKGLRKLGIAVLPEPAAADLGDAYRQIRELGAATGRREGAARVVKRIRSRIEELLSSAPAARGLTVFHELGPDLFSASSRTFIGRIYKRLGLRNIADEAATRASTDYPQLSAEAVVSADPDLVVLADTECCGQTPAKVARRPGWDAISAVRRDAVIAVDDDIASRWGPRLPRFIAAVARGIEAARAGAP
jgi:iron complex transport system substrate-binding protein